MSNRVGLYISTFLHLKPTIILLVYPSSAVTKIQKLTVYYLNLILKIGMKISNQKRKKIGWGRTVGERFSFCFHRGRLILIRKNQKDERLDGLTTT